MNTASMNDTAWLSVNDEAKMPADAYIDAKKNRPISAPNVPPLSILPGVYPRRYTDR